MHILLVIAGLVVLIFAGDLLVRGAVALSLRLGVPKVIVGLTVVAFGTSLPELLVSVEAAISGAPDIALGNVVGSNITNILLVLGVPALVSTVPPSGAGTRRSYVFVILASLLLMLLGWFGPMHYGDAAILLVLLAMLLGYMAWQARQDPAQVSGEVQELSTPMPNWLVAANLVVGLIGLPIGAGLLIDGAVGIARDLGISEAVIGLTLVAVGTSLPELATTVVAAIRRHADVAMGNVLGSNLFNILAILGITSLFGPLPVSEEFIGRDFWVMLGSAVLIAPFVLARRTLSRSVGTLFLVLYFGYYVLLFAQTGPAA